MGKLLSSYIFPHPPILIPEVGKGEEKKASATVAAVKAAAEKLRNDKPTTILVTTPHGPVFQDFIYIGVSEVLEGGLERFGCPHVQLRYENNIPLVEKIIAQANGEGIPCGDIDDRLAKKYGISKALDHGTLVPLYFVGQGTPPYKLVHISIAGLPNFDLYRFGMCIQRAVAETDEQVVFLASGDLSHKLSGEAPYGFHPRGPEFDELLVNSVRSLDVEKLVRMDEGLCESAGECGLRSFIMMFGALDGLKVASKVYSYEGPFGVGYAVAGFTVDGPDNGRKVLQKLEEEDMESMRTIRREEDPYVQLARVTLETYTREGKIPEIPEGLPAEMLERKAGTFVSIKKHGQLRGCIGTTAPTTENIAKEIMQNAISAGTQDPRFDQVEANELHQLVYSVDVLNAPEPIASMDALDVVKYGVIVRAGNRSGLLLPNLEGVETPEQQVSISLQKAGIRPTEKYSMERFEVVRHR